MSYAGAKESRICEEVDWEITRKWWLPGDSNPEPID